jgi:hypothetical protein
MEMTMSSNDMQALTDTLTIETQMISALTDDTRNLKIRALYAQGEALQSSEKPLNFEDYEDIAWNMGFLFALQAVFESHEDSDIATTLESIEQQFDKYGPVEFEAA